MDIEKKAQEILRDHNLVEIPVDPLKVARAMNIKVMNAKFSEPDKSGAIVKRQNTISIYVNYDDPPHRKRFTIAHEIGHLLLHMSAANDYEEIVDTEDNFRSTDIIEHGWSEERKMEWEANIFAAALLMDGEMIKKEWKNENDLRMMAWKFQVSESAMAIRLSNLDLIDEFI